MNHEDPLLQCALRIEQLVQQLTDKPNRCLHCPHEVSLPPDGPPLTEAKEGIYSQAGAAEFLERCEKQVYRYRVAKRLPFIRDEWGQYGYLKADLERLFEELHGFPKGGFRK